MSAAELARYEEIKSKAQKYVKFEELGWDTIRHYTPTCAEVVFLVEIIEREHYGEQSRERRRMEQ